MYRRHACKQLVPQQPRQQPQAGPHRHITGPVCAHRNARQPRARSQHQQPDVAHAPRTRNGKEDARCHRKGRQRMARGHGDVVQHLAHNAHLGVVHHSRRAWAFQKELAGAGEQNGEWCSTQPGPHQSGRQHQQRRGDPQDAPAIAQQRQPGPELRCHRHAQGVDGHKHLWLPPVQPQRCGHQKQHHRHTPDPERLALVGLRRCHGAPASDCRRGLGSADQPLQA